MCIDGNERSSSCRIVLSVESGALTESERSFRCEGIDSIGPSACAAEYGVEPSIQARAERTAIVWDVPGFGGYGSRFTLEYSEASGDARFCRVGVTDVDDDPSDECWPSDWQCARSGAVTLTEDPTSGAPILEFTATFADGGTVSGAF